MSDSQDAAPPAEMARSASGPYHSGPYNARVTPVHVGPVTFGTGALVLIAGPCVIESEAHALDLGHAIAAIARAAGIPYIFKASFDKANRTSLASFRGPGLESGLRDPRPGEAGGGRAGAHRHPRRRLRQRPRRPWSTCSRFRRSSAARRTCSWRPPGPAPSSTSRRASSSPRATCATRSRRCASRGTSNVLLTERGTSFGYHNLVVDMRALPQTAGPRRAGRLRRDPQPATARRR